MEIFMSNISFEANRDDIIRYIAGILHNPPYTLNPSRRSRMNFHVELKRGNNAPGRPHSGRACLTLPTEEIGRRFLADFRLGGLSFHRRTIRVKLSDRRLNSQIVDEIRSTLYEDPHTIEANGPHDNPIDGLGEAFDLRLTLLRAFSLPPPDPIAASKVKTIQFGWMCRDGVFSIEWEISPSSCGIFFDDDERQIRIKISNADQSSLIVVLRPSQIQFSSASLDSSRTPMLYFDLTQPPMFESQKRFAPTRQRLSSLNSDHEPFAPYTSLAMRLVCLDKEQLARYKRLCRTEKMRIPKDISVSSEYRGLFLPNVQKELRRWLRLLPWNVAFQVEALIQRLDVDFKEMLGLRQRIQALVQDRGEDHTSGFLHYFASYLRMLSWSEDEEGPWSIEQCFTHAKHEYEVQTRAPPISAPDTMDCRHVYVTPTTIVLEGPNPEQSNRIIRFYSEHQDRFLRVCFVDEGRLHYRFDKGVDRRAFIQNRVGHILREGLEIAGRPFQFLAYSMSGLKEHSVWFVSPFDDERHGHVDASTIIKGLGSFTKIEPRLIYCPARYGARISQAFTATDPSFVEIEEIIKIDDIERNGSVFTDGVGTISPEMARAIWIDSAARRKRRNRPYPRAFQIRCMGSKGMLSVDYKLSGYTICFRPSMIKFEAPESQKIEIAQAFDRPRNYYLNRPLIMLLEGLGVKYEAFKRFQDRAVTEVNSATKSLSGAAWMFERHGLGSSFRLPSVMLNLRKLGVETPDDPFFSRMMDYAVDHVLRDLKDYARIPIPGAWTLVGVADVHRYLEAGEIFACIKDPNSSETIYLEGPTLISRSPTIHPGDVQIAKAIGRPPVGSCFAKEPLANTVVFSVKGERSLPSCLGGGDLDGDEYNLVPLNKIPELTPRTEEPSDYPPAPKKFLDRPSTMQDVAEFVMEYIHSDVLGLVATQWLDTAGQSPEGIFDRDCLTLAALHSDAVDFQKSGQPVDTNKIPQRRTWPVPQTLCAIDRLSIAITLPDLQPRRTDMTGQPWPEDEAEVDVLLSLDDDEGGPLHLAVQRRVRHFLPPALIHMGETSQMFRRYSIALLEICTTHTLSHSRNALLVEEEALVGTIVIKTSQPRARAQVITKLRDQTDLLVRGIREELAGEGLEEESTAEEMLARAWACWKFSVAHKERFGGKSFGWIALGAIFEAIKAIEDE